MNKSLKLRLKKVTLRDLDEETLAGVAGGTCGNNTLTPGCVNNTEGCGTATCNLCGGTSGCCTCSGCNDGTSDPSDYCTVMVTCCPAGGHYCN